MERREIVIALQSAAYYRILPDGTKQAFKFIDKKGELSK